jgi:hypothetical protein
VHAFVCFLFARVLFSFFLRVFCLRALGFDDILSSFPFPKRRYFSIFLLFFRGETAQKGEMGTKKKARSEERKRVFFFVFWRERFVCCFAQKNTDMNHHVLCKGGGRGRSTRFRGFLLRPTTITSKLRVLLLLLLLKKELTTTRCKNKHPPRQRTWAVFN